MTRKRFVKLMMGHGVQRNVANEYARLREGDDSYFEMYSEIEWDDDGNACPRNPSIPFGVMAEAVYAAMNALAGFTEALGGTRMYIN